MSGYAADTAASRGLALCHLCFKLSPVEQHTCPRCGGHLHLRTPDSVQRAAAFLITAAILYIPANVLPIMYTDQLGSTIPSTILGGVILLWHHKSYPIAAVIFIASVMVPMGKLFSVGFLLWSVRAGRTRSKQQRTTLYRITEFVGRWSMIDVFVVSILVALIQLSGVIVIRPGAAAVSFAGVVIITMIAAEAFDPRLIWDAGEDTDE
jgi:paraquat-inducible protein A